MYADKFDQQHGSHARSSLLFRDEVESCQFMTQNMWTGLLIAVKEANTSIISSAYYCRRKRVTKQQVGLSCAGGTYYLYRYGSMKDLQLLLFLKLDNPID